MKASDRHELRKQLLANGYRPLPLLDKGIRIKGWSTATIDADWLAQYKRNGKYQNTGIRCDGLVAFDIDVLNEDLANDIEEITERACGLTDLCRVGKWPKRLLLYRLSGEPIRSRRTAKYEGHQVELLTSSGRQFAAYGIHPGTGEPYEWLDDQSPLQTRVDQLPAVGEDTINACMASITEYFENVGLTKDSPGNTIGSAGARLYDLNDDTPFELDGVATTWGDLSEGLTDTGVWANLMRENGEFGDSDGVHCYIGKGSGQPCAHDFPRDCTHFEQIIKQIPDLPPAPPDNLFANNPTALDDMLTKWVLMGDKSARRLAHPTRAYAIDAMKLSYRAFTVPTPTTAQPNKTTPAVDMWLNDIRALRADYVQLRPDHPDEPLIKQGEETIFNTYQKPVHEELYKGKGGELETLNEFLIHMIPNRVELDIFLDWHALKIRNPGWRMHGLLMVTSTYGTGRGTWYQILEKLLGQQYVHDMEYDDLVGNTSQSTYNEQFATSLVITVGEVLEKQQDQTHWQARHMAYERIKTLCEPVARPMHIKRKYGKNSIELVFASLLMSSNHDDAFAIEPGDRRLTVIDNGHVMLVEAANNLYERIEDWHENPANIARLYQLLWDRADRAVYDPFGNPPDTAAKRRMVDAGQSDIDILFAAFMAQLKGDIVVPYQWRQFAHPYRIGDEYDLPQGDKFERALTAVITKNACRIDDIPKSGMKIDGKVVRPWIIRNVERWKGSAIRAEIQAEILKNGPIAATVTNLIPK